MKRFAANPPVAYDTLRIGYASLVAPYKGADTLVAALGMLRERGVPFTCSIAGDAISTDFVTELQRTVAEKDMAGPVKLLGFVARDGLIDLYRSLNVLVFPSKFDEPFGISQVEAMAAGLLVISSGTGGAAEVVEHEKSGLLFAAKDAAGLASALETLPRDRGRWARLAEAGKGRAMEEFDIERSADALEAALTP